MKNKIIFPVAFLFLIIMSGCEKFLDINENPNAAEEPPINGLLANTTYTTAYNIFNVSDWTSYYTQYLASSSPGSDGDTYGEVNASGTWNGLYNTMTDIYDMQRFASEKGLSAYVGIAKILMALHLNTASNVWGDIPYSEAFLGVNNVTPVYNDQRAIYDTCIRLLNEGIMALEASSEDEEVDGPSDFIHAGNKAAWVKTGHALKARMLNQLSKTNEYNAASVLSELSMAYESNDDDAQVTSFAVRNPWAQVAVNNAGLLLDGWLSSYYVNATNGTTYGVFDPRLPLTASKTKFGDYRGTPNGKGRVGTGTENEESYLPTTGWYSSTSSPLQIVTYAECKFLAAEASFRSGNYSDAYSNYLAGIRANMEKMGLELDSINRYINDPVVSVGESNITLQLIFKEKYVACFLNPITWDDMRRFDYQYKDFTLPVNAVINTFIRRMNYPTVELSTNGANVPDVSVTDHLWWDQ